jgi:hypothetical protein
MLGIVLSTYTRIMSFNLHNPVKKHDYYAQFTNEDTEAKTGQITSPWLVKG